MCEDVLVRANEYCRWSGIRFGQLLVNVMKERLVQHAALAPDAPASTVVPRPQRWDLQRNQSDSMAFTTLFYIENEALEEAIMAYVTKHSVHHEALNCLAAHCPSGD
jgi:hypothetical protein